MTITALPQRFLLGLILAVSTIGAGLAIEAPAKGTLTVPGPLVLTPTELVLVDGRKVQGQLACELEGHLILYSPNLGTLRSFRKEFVASYTRGGKTVQLAAKRALSPEELQADLDWNGWPDAPPDVGAAKKAGAQAKPAYTTQKWGPPKRLLVWKDLSGQPKNSMFERGIPNEKENLPGTSFKGDIENWLVLGEPVAGDKLDRDTDIICPGAGLDKLYYVNMPDGGRIFRHLVVENYARIGFPAMDVWGNFWIHERGRQNMTRISGVEFLGPFHTFIKNARPSHVNVSLGGGDRNTPKYATPQTWDKSGYVLAQYIGVKKDKTASVEFLGTFISGDKFQVFSGACIIGPDSSVHSDTRNPDRVFKDGSLHLMDGALLGKRVWYNKGKSIDVDGGVLTAGLPDRPLTRDATILVCVTDYGGFSKGNTPSSLDGGGLVLSPQGSLRVFSSDPATAQLIFRSSQSDGRSTMNFINIDLLGEAVLDGVVFMDLWKGGLRLGDLKQKEAWKHISFVDCQSPKPEELYAVYQKDTPPSGYTENPAMKALSMSGWEMPEPALANDAALDKLRQDLQAAETRRNELQRAFQTVVGDDGQALATLILARVEWHKARRALWLAFAERMKANGGAKPAKP